MSVMVFHVLWIVFAFGDMSGSLSCFVVSLPKPFLVFKFVSAFFFVNSCFEDAFDCLWAFFVGDCRFATCSNYIAYFIEITLKVVFCYEFSRLLED